MVLPCVPVSPTTGWRWASSPSTPERVTSVAPRSRAATNSTLSGSTAGDHSTTSASYP